MHDDVAAERCEGGAGRGNTRTTRNNRWCANQKSAITQKLMSEAMNFPAS